MTIPRHKCHELRHGSGSLLVRDWGFEDAPAVIHHHGTPSCGLAVPAGWHASATLGIRIITFDRPGYGASTNEQGRSIADAARWTQRIADALGIEHFALMGTSGGGPHAAAAAAVLGNRVNRLCVSVGLGPVGLAGFDAAADMTRETEHEIAMARSSEPDLRRFIEAEMDADVPLESWFSQLPPADVEVLGRADVRVEEQAEDADMLRGGIEGWLEDDLALFGRPWGCDLSSITARTLLVYGKDDVLVPASHGDAYRRAIGHGQLVKLAGVGHWMRDAEPAILRWLVSGDDRPAVLDL